MLFVNRRIKLRKVCGDMDDRPFPSRSHADTADCRWIDIWGVFSPNRVISRSVIALVGSCLAGRGSWAWRLVGRVLAEPRSGRVGLWLRKIAC